MTKDNLNGHVFEVNCFDKAARQNIAFGLMKIAVALQENELHVLSGGIYIQQVDGGVKLISDIVLLEGKING